ncbi:MAG: extracellular solute-binding protein [Oscillospiraceae bacterium]
MKKNYIKAIAAATAIMLILCGCGSGKNVLDKDNPVTITVWHYYNGIQQRIFDELVKEFNETVGVEKGIIVESQNQGDVVGLTEKVIDSANQVVGSEEMPEIFAAYADTAYEINKMGLAVDITQYLSNDELSEYIDSFIDEGKFDNSGSIKLFPTAKSTEILMLNETDWNDFAQENDVEEAALATWEGITKTAKQYYEWTDAKTPEENDGKAFFGRDAYANYIIIGSLQLGTELFHVDNGKVTYQINKEVMRKLWDNFYVPYVSGWFGSYGKFRSDDAKTGAIIALVGSTSGASYFPTEVTREDGTTYPISAKIFPLPNFEGTEPYAVQQGAGMVITKTDVVKETACIEFLKWATKSENNIRFSISSGYLPVKTEANDKAKIDEAINKSPDKTSDVLYNTLMTGSQMTKEYKLYTNKAFEGGYGARRIVEYSMIDLVNADLEQINTMVASGMRRSDAVAQFTTDEHFEQWLQQFTDKLNGKK